ncbi:MAG: DHHA1 domain-containing protein [Halanaerobiales bacterium]|nr:DHHA1 domain-containing protein [Halanaerobiales bacterium]
MDYLKLLMKGSTASGIRRIEAVTGFNALEYINSQKELLKKSAQLLNSDLNDIPDKIDRMKNNLKELEKEVRSLKDKIAASKSTDLKDNLKTVNGVNLLTHKLKDVDNNALRKMADQLQNEIQSGIIVLASALDNKVLFVAKISKDLVKKGFNAGNIIGEVAKVAGGGGGGRPDMAQAGGSKVDKIDEALNKAEEIIKEK